MKAVDITENSSIIVKEVNEPCDFYVCMLTVKQKILKMVGGDRCVALHFRHYFMAETVYICFRSQS